MLDLASIGLDITGEAGDTARRTALAPGRLLVEAIRVRLAELLRCSVADVEAVRGQAAQDWPGYVQRLFADVGVRGLLVDGGNAPMDSDAVGRLSAVAGGLPMWPMLRTREYR